MNNDTKILACRPAEPAARSATEIAEELVGPIQWVSNEMGYCECPGISDHTTNDGRKDCVLYLDHAPTLHCLHASCKGAVEAKNRELRRAIGATGDGMPSLSRKEMKDRLAKMNAEANVRKRAASSKGAILRDYSWPYAEIIKDSPTELENNVAEHWKLLLAKFKAGDVVWIGERYDSGKPSHASHFRPIEQWVSQEPPGPLICPATFKPDSIARTNENILARRFLVVESDVLKKDEVGAIFRWLRDKVKLKLEAIVDTAGKSLHGWFAFPADYILNDLKLVLPALDCDPQLFTASQPVRLPSALREGKAQKLIYLTKEAL